MTRNQFQEMGSNSRPNSGSIPRPNSALDLEATPDLPQKGQMTLPRIKKPKQFEKIVNRNSDDNTGSKNGTLKRERSKRLSVNMDNIKGSVKETLTKAAAKITKQMSTDDTRDSLAKKSQSQIELRENATNLRPRRPKSQCRSRPESWNESEKDATLKIFKSTDDIFGSSVPPPIPKKDATPIASPTSNDSVFNFQPVLPPKIPEKPPKKENKPQKPPLKPPLPSKPKFEF